MENEKINIKCPKCSQVLAVRKPAKPGMYKLTCNKCNSIAKKLYESRGFSETGNEDEDEIELAMTVR